MAKLTHTVTTLFEDGRTTTKDIAKADEYETLRKAVGGYIETVPLFVTYEERRCRAYCNENGIAEGQRFNLPATTLWQMQVDPVRYRRNEMVLHGPIAVIQVRKPT